NISNPLSNSKNLTAAIKEFWPDRIFRIAAVIDRDGELVAAIPLLGKKSLFGVTHFHLPNNEWGNWGDLMVNRDYPVDQSCRWLARAITLLPCHAAIKFNQINSGQRSWQALLRFLRGGGRSIKKRLSFDVGMVKHAPSWKVFEKSLSNRFRKKIQKNRMRLESIGSVQFQFLMVEPDKVESVIKRIYLLEDRSWKARTGTTIRAQKRAKFMTEQALLLAEKRQLFVCFMQVGHEDAAFDFGFIGKNIFHSLKIAFDEKYRPYSPGQILALETIRHLHEKNKCVEMDTLGPISTATAKWSTHRKHLSNVWVSGNLPANNTWFDIMFGVKRKLEKTLDGLIRKPEISF
ncbi:MAG: GNAT family N-acetyltransferase, partial [Planctomycetota bacterium]